MTSAAGMPCPLCRVPLAMSDRQGIEIDYCPQCRGVWLDRGELDKIIERSSAEASPPPPPRQSERASPWQDQSYRAPQQPYGGGYGHPRKRKKSFFEDLFD